MGVTSFHLAQMLLTFFDVFSTHSLISRLAAFHRPIFQFTDTLFLSV